MQIFDLFFEILLLVDLFANLRLKVSEHIFEFSNGVLFSQILVQHSSSASVYLLFRGQPIFLHVNVVFDIVHLIDDRFDSLFLLFILFDLAPQVTNLIFQVFQLPVVGFHVFPKALCRVAMRSQTGKIGFQIFDLARVLLLEFGKDFQRLGVSRRIENVIESLLHDGGILEWPGRIFLMTKHNVLQNRLGHPEQQRYLLVQLATLVTQSLPISILVYRT
mmetsp:Transcript_18483/g.28607  ORF Transcript_18483/g.28607 Transcript_18483/m.28607 type:complete len:219 (+) Transcript_18483:582-1238(+)